jgi:putative transposase
MLIQKAYKTEIDPNNKQVTLLMKHAGCARLAWNWALKRIQDKTSKPNAIQLHRELNAEKQANFPFMYEVSKCAMQESLRDIQKAFTNFFEKRTGFPKFKSKNKAVGSFRLTGSIHVAENKIKLPRLGWIKLKESNYIPIDSKILSVTVSEKAGEWFVSVLTQQEVKPEIGQGIIGIDLGVKTLATCSDGTQYVNSKSLSKYELKIKHFQRKLARKTNKKSNRRKKLKNKIAKLWIKVANTRKDNINKATSEIVKNKHPQIIVLEDLNVKGMTKNHKLAKAICDASMREFRRQIEYKSKWFGVEVQFVDRFFPSSKTCNKCGEIKTNLKLSHRTFKCNCGFEIDRDLNAALNLKDTVSSTGINAHGDDKVHVGLPTGDRLRSENQTSISA